MGLEDQSDNELVVAIVKAAIGEASIYFQSYTLDHTDYGADSTVEISIGGEVEGKLRLKGRVAEQVSRVFSISRKTDDMKKLERSLRAENKKVEKLKDRLSRLHALADPNSKDFEP